MTLAVDEFIRRFLLHILSRASHRIRRYGLFAGSARKTSLALVRGLLCSSFRRSEDDLIDRDCAASIDDICKFRRYLIRSEG